MRLICKPVSLLEIIKVIRSISVIVNPVLVTPAMSCIMTDHVLQNGTRQAYLKLDHKSIIIALYGVCVNRALNLIMKRCFRKKMVGRFTKRRGQGNYLKHHKLYAWAYLVTGWVRPTATMAA